MNQKYNVETLESSINESLNEPFKFDIKKDDMLDSDIKVLEQARKTLRKDSIASIQKKLYQNQNATAIESSD